MSTRQHALSTAEIVVLSGVVVAAALFGVGRLSNPGAPATGQPPHWTEPVGVAIAAPACGSTGTQTSCQGSSSLVTISWQMLFRHTGGLDPGAGSRGADVFVSGGPTWTDQPDSGSVTWNGAQSNTNYSYRIEWLYDRNPRIVTWTESGSFTTPNCNPPLSASCTFSPTSVNTGQSVTWSASASGGTGSYQYSWSGTDGLSGSTQSVQKSYSTAGTKTGSVSVSSGNQSTSVSCTNGGATGVTVNAPAPTISSFGGSPSSIAGGRSSTLSWSSSNASSCSINQGIGSAPTSGSRTVSPSSTTTYTLTCMNDSGQATSAQTTVTILAQCADGIDNDGDGKIDLADAGCTDASDNDESGPFFGPPGWKEVAPQ